MLPSRIAVGVGNGNRGCKKSWDDARRRLQVGEAEMDDVVELMDLGGSGGGQPDEGYAPEGEGEGDTREDGKGERC